VDSALLALRGKSPLLPSTLRVGVSRTIGLAYLAGFFRAFQRSFPKVQLHVSHDTSAFILAAVESGERDAGVVSPPPRLPGGLEMARRFNDEFVLVLPPRSVAPQPLPISDLSGIVKRHRWLAITRKSITGKRLQAWLEQAGVRCEPALEA